MPSLTNEGVGIILRHTTEIESDHVCDFNISIRHVLKDKVSIYLHPTFCLT